MTTNTPKDGDTIAIWISCGAASAAAAILTVSMYGERCNIRLLNNPIQEEHEDNQRFVRDLSKYLGREIEVVINPDFPSCSIFDVFEKRKFVSSPYGAPCTGELKKKARQHWENNNHADWHVIGFTADEKHRHERFVKTERDNVLPILIDRGMTKDDCGKMMVALGLKMSIAYEIGMPNANCMGCVKSSSPAYWQLIKKIAPAQHDKMCEVTRRLGCKLVRLHGKRIYLDELPDGSYGKLKQMDLDCGFFCEEKWR
jgi:peroxiredoxin